MSDFIDRPGPHHPSNVMIWFMWSQSAEFVVPLRDQYNDAFGHLWFLIHSSNATFQVNSSACVLFSLAPKAFGTWLNVTTSWGVSNGLFKFPKAFWKTPKLFFCVLSQNLCSVLLGSVNQTFHYNIFIFLPCPCQRTLNVILEPTQDLFESSACFLLGVWLLFNRKNIHHA